MALTKEQKLSIVKDVSELLVSSKLTVVAQYSGIDVKSLQQLRKQARDNNTVVQVIKNRLVKQAIDSIDKFKDTDSSVLKSQLLYAFNSQDEVEPAHVLNQFAIKETNLKFVGAFTEDGAFIGPEDVKMLANLPSKDQLRAQLAGTIAAPLSGFIGVMNGNLRGLINALNARSLKAN